LANKTADSLASIVDSTSNILAQPKDVSDRSSYSSLDELLKAIPTIDVDSNFYSDYGLELSKKEFCLLKANCQNLDSINDRPLTRQIALGKIKLKDINWIFIDNVWLYPPKFGHSNYSVITLDSKFKFIQDNDFFNLVKSGPSGSVRFFVNNDTLKIEQDDYDCIEVGEDYECDMKTKRTIETKYKLLNTDLIELIQP
jgi:hypothetical protein